MYMDYISRNTLAKNNQQVLTSFDWDLDLSFSSTYAPYYPDNATIKQRLLNIEGLPTNPTGELITYRLRGYTMQQPGMTTVEPVSITLNFQDFEDQSINIWALDWQNKVNSWRNRYSYRKEDLYLDMTVYQLNSNRQPVFKWECKTGILESTTGTPTGSDEKSPLGAVGLSIQFEYIDYIPLNV